ncbi:MAG TPA: hypothetical protein VGU26_00590 [Gaiellaceae bacterium]|jgi:hypothetical protein|nr:hypothetical protein [Gaiellaceae bacterium]
MIVSLHVATGALGGLVAGSPAAAIVVGPILHVLGDRIPHEDIGSHSFEVRSGVAGVLALVLVRGPLDPATVGAVASAVPDVEHVVRLPRPGGRKLFPSHRIRGWHRPGGLSANVQLLLAGTILGAVLGAGLRGYIDHAGR